MGNRAFTMVMASFAGDESLPLEWTSALNKKQQIAQMLKQLR